VSATEPNQDNVLRSVLARDVRSYMRVRGQGDESEARELCHWATGVAAKPA
jgi:hypothetical protein